MTSANADNHFPPGQPPIRTSTIDLFRGQVDQFRSSRHTASMIGRVGGGPGTGKSTAAHLYLAEEEPKWRPPDQTCVMFDIMPQTTTKWLLDEIAYRICDTPRSRTSQEAFQQALTALEQRRVRLLMLDNADYLNLQHLEVLLALLGWSNCSVLLIGLPRLLTAFSTYPKIEACVVLSLPFPSLPDEEVFATFLPQLHLPGWMYDPQNEEDLFMGKYLWRKCRPSVRRLRVILTSAGLLAQLHGSPTITLETIRLAVQLTSREARPSSTQDGEEDV